MNPLGRDELAGEYVLSSLSRARCRDAEQRLINDGYLRQAVQRWQAQFLMRAALARSGRALGSVMGPD